jgi:hypothetical protein
MYDRHQGTSAWILGQNTKLKGEGETLAHLNHSSLLAKERLRENLTTIQHALNYLKLSKKGKNHFETYRGSL